MIPYVIEKDEKSREHVYDLYSRLLKDRIIFVNEDFGSVMANSIVAQLLFLESRDADKDIYMYINSRGGSVISMFAIFDVMSYIKSDIVTVGFGQCMSAGSFILAAGTKGKRYVLPNTEIMIHELSGSAEGKFNEIINSLENTKKIYDKMADYYRKFTGKTLSKIKKDMKIDSYMSAEEAIDYGLVDKLFETRD